VTVQAGTLAILTDGEISSSTWAKGNAGNVTVTADTLTINSQGFTQWGAGIFSQANSGSSGHAGVINVTASDIDMKDGLITSRSTGNVAAGNIVVNFSHWLRMDSSLISTTADTGNGGSITINGGELIDLQNSAFKTTVSGADSNGGDIYTAADTLVMDTGLIQANAVGGSGGNITLKLDSLIPSGNTLIKGGSTLAWQPFAASFNVIQAASQAGVSGAVNVTAPQLNLSGIIANLGGPQFDTSIIRQDYCGLDNGSSLTRKGAGGLLPKSGDQLAF
jgi:hypothetical protein